MLISTHSVFFLMRRRPPRSTRTDTLFPYPTLFRSDQFLRKAGGHGEIEGVAPVEIFRPLRVAAEIRDRGLDLDGPHPAVRGEAEQVDAPARAQTEFGDDAIAHRPPQPPAATRHLCGGGSEERRVGKEGVRTGRSRWARV